MDENIKNEEIKTTETVELPKKEGSVKKQKMEKLTPVKFTNPLIKKAGESDKEHQKRKNAAKRRRQGR